MLAQSTRLLVLLCYLLLAVFVAGGIYGTWWPSSDGSSLWFYTAVFGLFLSDLLLAPFFSKPGDVVANGLVCLFAFLAYRPTVFFGTYGAFFWWLGLCWTVLMTLASALLMFRGKQVILELNQRWDVLRRSVVELGSAKYMFTLVFIYSVVQFHQKDPVEAAILGFLWFSVFTLRPLEFAAERIREWRGISKERDPAAAGFLLARQEPNVSLLQASDRNPIGFGVPILINSTANEVQFGMSLDTQWLATETWIRVLRLPQVVVDREALPQAWQRTSGEVGRAVRVSDTELPETLSVALKRARTDFVGLVATDTDLTTLRFDVLRDHAGLSEGQLVRTRIGGQDVLFQIVGGMTAEEILQQKNTVGYARGTAKKIGVWNETTGIFETARWIPVFNEPVFLVQPTKAEPDRTRVGVFPGTSYAVRVDPHSLVTHNAAVLGILGSGKTFLVYELIERVVGVGAKVMCLDITTRYAEHLKDLTDPDKTNAMRDALTEEIKNGKTNVQQNKEEGGSVQAFAAKLDVQVKAFLDDPDWNILILNPSEFSVWRQTSNPYQNTASMSSLSIAEIAQMVTEAALKAIPKVDTEEAKLCLVYEEAHSLIPEWNSAVNEGDQRAALGTAKSIMQGRKFGMGAIVVTQRTANVTKSILSQCNSLFAFRVFDATGVEFLRNFVGSEYADVLSALEDRHMVVFGRASSCRQPVLVRVNERDDFIKAFRKTRT